MNYPKGLGISIVALMLLSATPSLASDVASITCTTHVQYIDTCSYTGKNTGADAYWFYNLIGNAPTYSGLIASAEPNGTQTNIPNGNDNCGAPTTGHDISLYADTAGTILLCGTRYSCATDTWTSFGPCVNAVPPAPTPASPSSSGGGTSRMGTINVVKIVVNDNGGARTISDFPLYVNGNRVASGVTNDYLATGDVFTVTEAGDAGYIRTFSGDCDINGQLNLNPGDNRVCIVTNDDIFVPAPPPIVIPPEPPPPPPVVIPPVPPLIDVVKVPNPLALTHGPGPVEYTYTLRNIGTVPVTNITMIGDSCSPITLISGDANADAKLDVDETWVYRCTTTLSQTHTNTVVATGWANGLSAIDLASATVVVSAPELPNAGIAAPPLIHVTKIPSPLTLPAGGGDVTYTERITNPGKVALSHVRITDDKCAPLKRISGDKNGDGELDPSEAWIYTCKAKLSKTTTNTAVVIGSANGFTVRDFAVATVVVATPVPALPIAAARTLPVVTASATSTVALASRILTWSLVAAGAFVAVLLYAMHLIAPRRKKKRIASRGR